MALISSKRFDIHVCRQNWSRVNLGLLFRYFLSNLMSIFIVLKFLTKLKLNFGPYVFG